MESEINATSARNCLMAWADVTAFSLTLLEASLHMEFPSLSEESLRVKVNERLNIYRDMRFSQE